MKHLLSTLDTFSFRRHKGFTKQDGNTGFCSSEQLETEKRKSRCWRTKIFRIVSTETPNVGRMGICFLLLSNVPKLRTWSGWGYAFFSCQMSLRVVHCFSTVDHLSVWFCDFLSGLHFASILPIQKHTAKLTLESPLKTLPFGLIFGPRWILTRDPNGLSRIN